LSSIIFSGHASIVAKGVLHRGLQGLAGSDDENDLAHVHGERSRLRCQKQGRRIEHDDSVAVSPRQLVDQPSHRLAGKKLRGSRMGGPTAKKGQLLDVRF
jgi:hypothetical protein